MEPAGVLDDYGCVAEAYCALHQATGDGYWLERAGVLLDTALERFADGRGGFYDTADDGESLVARPADPAARTNNTGVSPALTARNSANASPSWCGRAFDAGL